VIPGTGFYGSNDPTDGVKALKEVMVLRNRLQSHQVHLTMSQYYTVHVHSIYSQTHNNTYTKMRRPAIKIRTHTTRVHTSCVHRPLSENDIRVQSTGRGLDTDSVRAIYG